MYYYCESSDIFNRNGILIIQITIFNECGSIEDI